MPSPITPDVIYELTSYSSPTLSPDGSLLAFAQSKVDSDSMEANSRIMLNSLDGESAHAFTQGPSDSAPQFSPDGKTLAFIRPDDKNRAQIWTISIGGGEATKATSVEGGVAEFSWSPNSDALAFASDVDPNRAPDDHDHSKDPRVRIVRRITYRADGLGWRGDMFRQLFVVNLSDGTTRSSPTATTTTVRPAGRPTARASPSSQPAAPTRRPSPTTRSTSCLPVVASFSAGPRASPASGLWRGCPTLRDWW